MQNTPPLLVDRVKATVIDSLVVIGMMYAATEFFALFDTIYTYVKITVTIFIFLLYDPLFTHFFGGTIGHSFSDIGVRKEADQSSYISFPAALLRFLLKYVLGWVSLLTVTNSDKKKAIHDFAVKSIVVYVNTKKK